MASSLSRAFVPPWNLDAWAIGAGALSDQTPVSLALADRNPSDPKSEDLRMSLT
jgi:hypothetical protein